jgi:hypothetical protein
LFPISVARPAVLSPKRLRYARELDFVAGSWSARYRSHDMFSLRRRHAVGASGWCLRGGRSVKRGGTWRGPVASGSWNGQFGGRRVDCGRAALVGRGCSNLADRVWAAAGCSLGDVVGQNGPGATNYNPTSGSDFQGTNARGSRAAGCETRRRQHRSKPGPGNGTFETPLSRKRSHSRSIHPFRGLCITA